MERFNLQLAPVPMAELTAEMRKAKEEKAQVREVMAYCREHMTVKVKEEALGIHRGDEGGCPKAGGSVRLQRGRPSQCWNALQEEVGIMPCAANSLLNEEGFPVACETDVHGAITSLLVEAAALDGTRSFFADWTVRHPDNENGERFASTAGRGPFRWLRKSPPSAIPWRLTIRGRLRLWQSTGK